MPSSASKSTHVDPLWYKDAVIYELHVKPFTTATATGSAIFAD